MKKPTLSNHRKFMRIAIQEAGKGIGKTAPNPVVGCVIIKDNKIISKAHHKYFGGAHAEAAALKKAKQRAKNATLYVTMEPCSYPGKRPPCTGAIIEAGIKNVVAAMQDPNPANDGNGFKQLRKKGIPIICGVMKKEAERLNRSFIARMKKKRPSVTVKMAQSLDGKIATKEGDSKWISSTASRRIVQGLRAKHDGVMVGINTIIRDNPRLTVRGSRRGPIKIVVDSRLRTPLNARIFAKASSGRVIIAATEKASKAKAALLKERGAEIVRTQPKAGRVGLPMLMKQLARMGITSILAEGGGELTASLLDNRLADKIFLFLAPIFIGGRDSLTSVEGEGISSIRDGLKLDDIKFERVERDMLITGDISS